MGNRLADFGTDWKRGQTWESAGLSKNRLQIRLFGPYLSSFSVHSYDYEPSNELKSVLKHLNFRFGPYSPTDSWKLTRLAAPVTVYPLSLFFWAPAFAAVMCEQVLLQVA